jgi:hypothetical protein
MENKGVLKPRTGGERFALLVGERTEEAWDEHGK